MLVSRNVRQTVSSGVARRVRCRCSIVAVVLATLWLVGCGKRHVDALPSRAVDARTVVVLVPGTTGTALIEADGGRILWGDGRSLMRPRDHGYVLALPLDGEVEPSVVPGDALDRLALGPLAVQVYGPWKEWMAEQGCATGDVREPEAEGCFFVFPYDWRRSNVDAARALGTWLETLAQRRGGPLRVVLLAQSNGGLITRYLTKYGQATLDEAAAGTRRPLRDVSLLGYALVGTANGGSIRVLQEMNEGRRNVPLVGRSWPPEVLFTFPGLYEALPIHRRDLFVDVDGEALDVDLYDARVWVEHGWSIFGEDVSRRVARRIDRRPERVRLFGDLARRQAFLQDQLDEALRLHDVLGRDPVGWSAPPWLSMQHGDRDTPERGQLLLKGSRTTLRLGKAGTTELGDGHATRASQEFVSPGERAALQEPPLYADGTHFSVILSAEVKQRFADFLVELGALLPPSAAVPR